MFFVMNFVEVSTFLSAVIHGVVGARLLYLAGQTKKLPEAAIGGALTLLAVAKFFVVGAHALNAFEPVTVDIIEKALSALSHLLFFVVWWQVFRADALWAKLFTLLAAILLVGGFAYQLNQGWVLGSHAWGTWYNQFRIDVAVVAFLWGAVECFAYVGRLRKRARIGLAAPSMALRFALWGTSVSVTLIIPLALHLQLDAALLSSTITLAIWPVSNLISGLCLWFSFLTPPALIRFVDRNYQMEAA